MSELSREQLSSLFEKNPYIRNILDKDWRIDPKNETGLLMKNGDLVDSVARDILRILIDTKGFTEYYTLSQWKRGDKLFYGHLVEGKCLYTYNWTKKKAITAASRIEAPKNIWIPQRDIYLANATEINHLKKELEWYPENMQFVSNVSPIDSQGSFYGNYILKKGHPFFNKEQDISTLLLEEIATQMSQVALSLSWQKISTSYSSSYIDITWRDCISPVSSDIESIEIYLSGKIKNNPEKITKTWKEGFEILYTVYTQNIAQASWVLILLK